MVELAPEILATAMEPGGWLTRSATWLASRSIRASATAPSFAPGQAGVSERPRRGIERVGRDACHTRRRFGDGQQRRGSHLSP